MANTKVVKTYPNGDIDIEAICECGKPLVVANEYGMFCEERCGEEESKRLSRKYKEILNEIEADDGLATIASLLSSLFDDI